MNNRTKKLLAVGFFFLSSMPLLLSLDGSRFSSASAAAGGREDSRVAIYNKLLRELAKEENREEYWHIFAADFDTLSGSLGGVPVAPLVKVESLLSLAMDEEAMANASISIEHMRGLLLRLPEINFEILQKKLTDQREKFENPEELGDHSIFTAEEVARLSSHELPSLWDMSPYERPLYLRRLIITHEHLKVARVEMFHGMSLVEYEKIFQFAFQHALNFFFEGNWHEVMPEQQILFAQAFIAFMKYSIESGIEGLNLRILLEDEKARDFFESLQKGSRTYSTQKELVYVYALLTAGYKDNDFLAAVGRFLSGIITTTRVDLMEYTKALLTLLALKIFDGSIDDWTLSQTSLLTDKQRLGLRYPLQSLALWRHGLAKELKNAFIFLGRTDSRKNRVRDYLRSNKPHLYHLQKEYTVGGLASRISDLQAEAFQLERLVESTTSQSELERRFLLFASQVAEINREVLAKIAEEKRREAEEAALRVAQEEAAVREGARKKEELAARVSSFSAQRAQKTLQGSLGLWRDKTRDNLSKRAAERDLLEKAERAAAERQTALVKDAATKWQRVDAQGKQKRAAVEEAKVKLQSYAAGLRGRIAAKKATERARQEEEARLERLRQEEAALRLKQLEVERERRVLEEAAVRERAAALAAAERRWQGGREERAGVAERAGVRESVDAAHADRLASYARTNTTFDATVQAELSARRAGAQASDPRQGEYVEKILAMLKKVQSLTGPARFIQMNAAANVVETEISRLNDEGWAFLKSGIAAAAINFTLLQEASRSARISSPGLLLICERLGIK